MKLRSTTPSSRKFKTRAGLVLIALTLAIATPVALTRQANADDYDAKIAALQHEIDKYQAAAQALGSKADTLQRKLDGIKNEINQLQTKINLNQVKYDQLVAKIKKTEKQISDNRDALGEVIANLSIDGDISALEMLASAKNIADYVDKQTYQSSMRDELKSTITRIKDLKDQLEKQKQETELVLTNQKKAQKALDAKRAEQQRLVNETRGQEAGYRSLQAKSKAEQQRVREAQQAAIAAAIASSGGGTLVSGGAAGDYPWNSGNCPMVGYWSTGGVPPYNGEDGHGYGCRQCASYAAWRVAKETGMYPEGWGNAKDFPSSAQGIFNTGYTPRAGSLGVMGPGSSGAAEGHIVWVEQVGTGSHAGQLLVSQYNYDYGAGYGMYSKMWLSASIFDYGFIYIK